MNPHTTHAIFEYIGVGLFAVMVLYSLVNFVLPLLSSLFLRFYTWIAALVVRFESYLVDLETRRKERLSRSEPTA